MIHPVKLPNSTFRVLSSNLNFLVTTKPVSLLFSSFFALDERSKYRS